MKYTAGPLDSNLRKRLAPRAILKPQNEVYDYIWKLLQGQRPKKFISMHHWATQRMSALSCIQIVIATSLDFQLSIFQPEGSFIQYRNSLSRFMHSNFAYCHENSTMTLFVFSYTPFQGLYPNLALKIYATALNKKNADPISYVLLSNKQQTTHDLLCEKGCIWAQSWYQPYYSPDCCNFFIPTMIKTKQQLLQQHSDMSKIHYLCEFSLLPLKAIHYNAQLR